MTYVFFDPDFEGPNNLRLSLTFALTLARLLNRTLVLPPPLPVLHWDWGARPSEQMLEKLTRGGGGPHRRCHRYG